jgi:DNA uptake protein ComE-like DNA-binding protein
LLAPVPFAYGAVRLRQRRLWAVTAACASGVVALFVFSEAPDGSWGDVVFGLVLVALMLGGTVHALVLRGRVFTPAPAAPATAAALAAGTHAEDAGAVAAGGVAPAGALRVGGPELAGQVDDGGLVDVNHVPAQVLVDRLGLSPAQAGRVVQARERRGGFAGATDLVAGSALPEATVDALRERLLFVAIERVTDPHDDRPDTPRSEDATGMPSTPPATEDSTHAREFR